MSAEDRLSEALRTLRERVRGGTGVLDLVRDASAALREGRVRALDRIVSVLAQRPVRTTPKPRRRTLAPPSAAAPARPEPAPAPAAHPSAAKKKEPSLFVAARDPEWVFAKWELRSDLPENVDLVVEDAESGREVHVERAPRTGKAYVHVPEPGVGYVAALRIPGGTEIVRSKPVRVPAVAPSSGAPRFVDTSAQAARLEGGPPWSPDEIVRRASWYVGPTVAPERVGAPPSSPRRSLPRS